MSEYLRPEYTPLFTQVQDFIADQLNTDPQLSALGIEFLPEHRLDIEYEIQNNLGKQGTVGIVNTLKGTYGGHNGSTNAWEIEAEVDVLENPPVRRAQMKKMGLSAGSTADILDWVQESMCGPSSPTYGKFCAMSQELGEDRGIIVGRSIMKTFAIADVSAVVSGENQWICPYALLSDLSALSGQVQDIVVELDNKRDKTDFAVYNYAPWTMYSYNEEEVTPPLNFNYQKITYDDGREIYGWMSEREYSGMWQIIAQYDNGTWFTQGGTIDEQGRFTALGGDSLVISDDGLAFTVEGAIPVDIRRTTVGLVPTSDTIAKVSQLPTKTSDLTNDSGFITASDLSTELSADFNNKRDKTDLSVYVDEVAPWYGTNGQGNVTQYNWDADENMWKPSSGVTRLMYDGNSTWQMGIKVGSIYRWTSSVTGAEDALYLDLGGYVLRRDSVYQPVATDDMLAKVSQIPTSFDKIEDLSANVINANRTVSYIDEVDYWSDYSYPLDPLNWDAENNWWRADISPSFYMKLQFNSGTWTLETGENIGGEWYIESDSVQDSEQATFLMFDV